MKEHRFCLGKSAMTGAPKLHALLREEAPVGAHSNWCSRSPIIEDDGKCYMTIYTDHGPNLMKAVLRWQEPEIGE